MGVKYLTSYINANQGSFLTRIEFSHQDIIIDGSAFVFHLYREDIGMEQCSRLNYRLGGEYIQFAKRIEHFFNKLKQYSIRPFVIFDGTCILKTYKVETMKSRTADTIKKAASLRTTSRDVEILPPLAEMTMIHVLRRLRIPFIRSEKDADSEIAALAQKWQCLVLSKDSDFFIFNLNRGYVSFDKLFIDNNNDCLVGYVYFQQKFIQRHGIQSSILPLVATLLGNDYVSLEDLHEIYLVMHIRLRDTIKEKIIAILNWFKKKNITSLQDYLQSGVLSAVPQGKTEILLAKLKYSIQFYSQNVDISVIEGHLRREYVPSSSEVFKDDEQDDYHWITHLYRYSRFPSFALDILYSKSVTFRPSIEDIKLPSIHNCTQALRDIIYSVLLIKQQVNDVVYYPNQGNHVRRYDSHNQEDETIREWDRINGYDYAAKYIKLKELPVFLYKNQTLIPIPYLHDLRLSNRKGRLQFLLTVFDCHDTDLKELNLCWWLVVVSIRYWFKRCIQESQHHQLYCLIVCIVNLYYDEVKEFPALQDNM